MKIGKKGKTRPLLYFTLLFLLPFTKFPTQTHVLFFLLEEEEDSFIIAFHQKLLLLDDFPTTETTPRFVSGDARERASMEHQQNKPQQPTIVRPPLPDDFEYHAPRVTQSHTQQHHQRRQQQQPVAVAQPVRQPVAQSQQQPHEPTGPQILPPPRTGDPDLNHNHKDISTELIQKYLDENQNLILAILENQNVGRLAECARYQNRLQQNLMYLASIVDE